MSRGKKFEVYVEVDEEGFQVDVVEFEIYDKFNQPNPVPRNYVPSNQKSLYKPKWDFYKEEWFEGDNNLALESKKNAKEEELNEECASSILRGFTHIINGEKCQFSFDYEAQLNFQGVERLLGEGVINEVMWTVRKGGEHARIPVNRSLMNELTIKILQHKDDNISRFRDILMPKVKSAQTLEEIEAITWEVRR